MTINEKPWMREEVCKALKYQRETTHVIRDHVSSENYIKNHRLIKLAETANFADWPKDLRKDDYYTSEEGMYKSLFSIQQSKAKTFKKYCCNTMFPRIQQQLTDKIQKEHQQAISWNTKRASACHQRP